MEEIHAPNEKIDLSNEQKLAVLKCWNSDPLSPPSISDLVKLTFPSAPSFDGRTKYGRAIRFFLSEKGLEATTSEFKAKGFIELSEEQKEYILNNANAMKPLEMARVLFKNPNLAVTSQEARSVFNHIKTLDINLVLNTGDETPTEDYKPPKTVDHVVARINKYKRDAGFDAKKLSPRQKKQCSSLISYLHTYRFIHQMNTYQSVGDRTLFESTFIKYAFDKEDLTEEDVDQYIILAGEVVIASSIQGTISLLQEEQDRIVAEQGKMSMVLVEAINTARTEYNASVKRQQSLYKDLVHERSKRIKAEKEGASILNLVALWKEEKSRKQLLKIGEDRKVKLKEAIDELSTMEDVKARIYGISEAEILDG
jgi:hypothetical protein